MIATTPYAIGTAAVQVANTQQPSTIMVQTGSVAVNMGGPNVAAGTAGGIVLAASTVNVFPNLAGPLYLILNTGSTPSNCNVLIGGLP
jgi:hypothetical protein